MRTVGCKTATITRFKKLYTSRSIKKIRPALVFAAFGSREAPLLHDKRDGAKRKCPDPFKVLNLKITRCH